MVHWTAGSRSSPEERAARRAHALALAAEGADVVVADAPRPMNLTYPLAPRISSSHAKEIQELGGRCLPIAVDVRDAAAVSAASRKP